LKPITSATGSPGRARSGSSSRSVGRPARSPPGRRRARRQRRSSTAPVRLRAGRRRRPARDRASGRGGRGANGRARRCVAQHRRPRFRSVRAEHERRALRSRRGRRRRPRPKLEVDIQTQTGVEPLHERDGPGLGLGLRGALYFFGDGSSSTLPPDHRTHWTACKANRPQRKYSSISRTTKRGSPSACSARSRNAAECCSTTW